MDKIEELLNRGVEKIYPSKEALKEVLKTGKKLRLYWGVDPSGEKLHLGHVVALRKMRQFQDLEHQVILLIGDFTGMIGDPTDKTATRKKLTHGEVLENAKTYKEQAGKILRFEGENPVEIKFNSHWLANLTLKEVVELASNFTVQQMLERDVFERRLKEGKPIHLHEFLYPLMQGYDTVATDVDLEIGGKDQTFNMLAGRILMRVLKNKEKFVLTTPLLAEPGGVKMGKTEGDLVALTEEPNQMFGQIMALSDKMIIQGLTLLTDIPMEEIQKKEKELRSEIINPMNMKKRLAFEIISSLHSSEKAKAAQTEFERVFQKRQAPVYNILTYYISTRDVNIIDLLVNSKLVSSRSEAKRLIEQGGVEVNGKLFDGEREKFNILVKDGMIVKVGKRRFVKLRTGD